MVPTQFSSLSALYEVTSDLSNRTTCLRKSDKYEACPESKDTKVLNMYKIFNLQKRHSESIAYT
jgi:hypothetical protein